MAYTPVTVIGARLVDMLAPWANDDFAMYLDAIGSMFDPIATLVQDHGQPSDLDYIPGWGSVFDIDLCPASDLPYLGQYVGVQIPVGTSAADARALVRGESGMNRGTLASIQSAIVRNITTPWQPDTAYAAGVLVSYETGAGVVYYVTNTAFTSGGTFSTANLSPTDPSIWYRIFERQMPDGTADGYHLTVIVRPEQLTPVNDTTAVTAAIKATKPAGIILHVIATDSPRIRDATKRINEVAGTVTIANVSTGDV